MSFPKESGDRVIYGGREFIAPDEITLRAANAKIYGKLFINDQEVTPGGGGGTTDQTVESVAETTYSVVAGDSGKLKMMTGTATVTLPSGELTVGQRVDFVSIGGPTTFSLGGGATWEVPPTPSAVTRAVGSFVSAIKTGAAKWALTGDLA